MSFFSHAYSNRDYDFYEYQLSEDFVFLTPLEMDFFRATELAIADKMFHEMEGAGGYVIGDITFDQLESQGAWIETPASDPDLADYPQSLRRTYEVQIRFALPGQNLILIGRGIVVIYVLDVGATGAPDFKLLGMRDLTFGPGKGSEDNSWSLVKELFL